MNKDGQCKKITEVDRWNIILIFTIIFFLIGCPFVDEWIRKITGSEKVSIILIVKTLIFALLFRLILW